MDTSPPSLSRVQIESTSKTSTAESTWTPIFEQEQDPLSSPLSSSLISTIPGSLTGILLLADKANGLLPLDSLEDLPLSSYNHLDSIR